MRRGTLVVIILLFLALAVAAFFQIRLFIREVDRPPPLPTTGASP